jgi:hypothetical protein
MFASPASQAAITCERYLAANVVAFDKPIMYNRLGAGNINGTMYALKRDVVDANGVPLTLLPALPTPTIGDSASLVDLRGDKRQRPLILRVRVGDCLTVNLTNLLTQAPNPRQLPFPQTNPPEQIVTPAGQVFTVQLDDQPAERRVGFHAAGLQLVNGIADDGSNVGVNASSLTAAAGGTASYTLYAAKEGVFVVSNPASTFGSDGNMGNNSNGLFGQVIVEPRGAKIYRSQVFEEEMRLAQAASTGKGQPIIDYEALYPPREPWISEGKAGLPVLNMITPAGEIVHSEINAVIAGSNADGSFPATTYPLESVNRRNPTLPNRLEPFREFASVFHDETVNGQAFPQWYKPVPGKPLSRVFSYVLAGVKDAFMINYGSGGIGSEIIANRLGVGPMHDCLDCSYEEFFLTSFTVGDPALTVDVPANFGLENCAPDDITPGGAGDPANCAAVGRKANYAVGAEDPANIHHSYISDFTKFRNTHNGKEQHVFHLHNHQWLYNPNDDNSNYLDAQGIGPGAGYTYEINLGGSGNRNKSTGDAIFHCHFYPHFAQGMWYHWRNNDVFQTGTLLQASVTAGATTTVPGRNGTFHAVRWALANTIPAKVDQTCVDDEAAGRVCERVRAYPDGEIATGTPIPALVPLPGKPMPEMPAAAVTVVAKIGANGQVLGSNARVQRNGGHAGFPFFVAGIEDSVGHRPPTPPMDMVNTNDLRRARTNNPDLFGDLDPDNSAIAAQAQGWDGGLPRHTLQGYADGGQDAFNVVTPIDFSKGIGKAKAVFFAEEGTDLEQIAMAYHSQRCVDSFRPDGSPALCQAATNQEGKKFRGGFVLNGSKPRVGAVFHNPCVDDQGSVLRPGVLGSFFSGESATGNPMNTHGRSAFDDLNPRIVKGTNLQYDAVLTKTGYHNPQQRIVALWQDVGPIIAKNKPGEPLVMRFDTFDCGLYHHSNLVPAHYEIDDYQVRTPTDIIGQHIHLPKWDLTTTDGAANGWNYEDGTMSPDVVRERIEAINCFNGHAESCHEGVAPGTPTGAPLLEAKAHPYFGGVAAALGPRFTDAWLGARTTIQRWFFDPVVNTEGTDRGLGIIFTHDHYGPSSHQQIGLYSTVLTEPAGSKWAHNETGVQLGCSVPGDRPTATPSGTTAANNTPCRFDGGPTSWQAAILPQGTDADALSNVGAGTLEPFREFYFEYSDFQHAYEAGVYVGTGQDGLPLPGTGPAQPPQFVNLGNPDFPAGGTAADTFRFAINPPARFQINPVFPDLVLEALNCVKDVDGTVLLSRPCPQAIDVQDPGVLSVNYRMEPVGLRIYDPNKPGPDGKNGAQADGDRGDLALALQSRTDRAIAQLNVQPGAGTVINGTRFPPPINAAGVAAGDPFTPMIRTYTGDKVRVKIQAGGHEEEHNATIHGLKWLQAGSGHGKAPNSGWRNAQAAGISEQFTLDIPVVPSSQNVASADYFYSVDAGNDGWWSGMWGILRSYNTNRNDLFALPTTQVPVRIANGNQFNQRGACPNAAPVRSYDITAVLANNVLANALGATIPTTGPVATQHVGAPLDAAGGTLVYNHRNATVGGQVIADPENPGEQLVLPTHQGPLHDPTAILYVHTDDLVPQGAANTPANRRNMAIPVKLRDGAPVEPVVLRAAAGECLSVVLRNRLPAVVPDLATYSMIQGVVKRDRFVGAGNPAAQQGATTFNVNLFRASGSVGVTPGLLAFDVNRDSGIVIGSNPAGNARVQPGGNKTFFWYAGDVSATKSGGRYTLVATPVEFGGANILPADRVKQGAKSLVGAVSVEASGATWAEDFQVFDHQSGGGTRETRAQAKVNNDAFRSFSLVFTKGLTQHYGDGSPVEHMNGEGLGIPEDSQEASGMALNYGIEPAWFRFGLVPQAPFGGAGCGAGCYGGVPNAGDYYSNFLTVPGAGGQQGDPVTPVFQAKAGQPTRIHITNPYGTTRGSTFALHGHVWQRDPYVCPGEARNGLAGACTLAGVGSKAIGVNPMGFAQGGQESWNAPSHFEIVLPGAGGWPAAGGDNAVPGDYLFRDHASFGNASGVWGILRVQ